jgi:hypothetical protein
MADVPPHESEAPNGIGLKLIMEQLNVSKIPKLTLGADQSEIEDTLLIGVKSTSLKKLKIGHCSELLPLLVFNSIIQRECFIEDLYLDTTPDKWALTQVLLLNQLASLDLSFYHCAGEEVEMIKEALPQALKLTKLTWRAYWKHKFDIVNYSLNLEYLKIKCTNVDVPSLLEALERNNPNLHTLILIDQSFSLANLELLRKLMDTHGNIRNLEFQLAQKLDPSKCLKLLGLKLNTSLTHLTIHQSGISQKMLNELQQCLKKLFKKNNTLCYLKLNQEILVDKENQIWLDNHRR